MTLVPKPDLSFLGTGDYDMVVFAWVGSPFVAGSKDLWITNGGSNYNKYSNPQVDTLLTKAASDLDPTQEAADFNAADEIMAAGRQRSPAVPEAGLHRGVEPVRQHPQQRDQRWTCVQHAGVGP